MMKDFTLSRRNFLKATAITGLAAAISGSFKGIEKAAEAATEETK